MKISNLPDKYLKIWEKVEPMLGQGRPGDDTHAKETAEMILGYEGEHKIDYDILIPVAMMHDVGHIAILPEHFKYVTGPEKIMNGKLVHMLTGAKIAKEILDSIGYDSTKAKEIVEIISIHDADQLKGIELDRIYDTENKKIFHDFDAMDRYTPERLKNMRSLYLDKSELMKALESLLANFFFEEFRNIAKERFAKL